VPHGLPSLSSLDALQILFKLFSYKIIVQQAPRRSKTAHRLLLHELHLGRVDAENTSSRAMHACVEDCMHACSACKHVHLFTTLHVHRHNQLQATGYMYTAMQSIP
jgi:hypothetical protein